MNLKKIILTFICIIATFSCVDYKTSGSVKKKEKMYYASSGFALIYDDNHYIQKVVNKKISNKNLEVMHSLLKRNTPIKIINPDNSKVVETRVSKRGNYPKIFKVVISKEIASLLELDINNPYIEIVELKKNKKFIAKEVDIFDEEKKVAGTVQINEITIDDVSIDKSVIIKDKDSKKNSDFIIVISDFYYPDSAKNLKKHLQNKNFNFEKKDICKIKTNHEYFRSCDYVFHFAGIGDIVPSIDDPLKYFKTNIMGTAKVLEASRHASVKKFIYAASSSCYGIAKIPTSEKNNSRSKKKLVVHSGSSLIFYSKLTVCLL